MTTKTKAPFEITKSGEVFANDDGLDTWNSYPESELSPVDEISLNVDPLSGEVSILSEEMEPVSGAAPPGIGSYPSPQSHQSAQGPMPTSQLSSEGYMPDYLSADTTAEDEDMERYRKSLLKILETDRDREIQKGSFLRDRELYRVLAKGWDTNEKIENIVKSVKLMMSIYRDAKFLDKASQVLLAFDPTLPTTQFISRKNWISKVHEIPRDRRITFQKSASNDGHHYISGIISDTSVDRDGDRFTYSALKIEAPRSNGKYLRTVTFTVTNSGKRAGAEVAELYVGKQNSQIIRSIKELKGFQKVFLNPGESKQVTLELDQRSVSFYNVDKHQWDTEPGIYNVLIGTSSRDIRLSGQFD